MKTIILQTGSVDMVVAFLHLFAGNRIVGFGVGSNNLITSDFDFYNVYCQDFQWACF